MLVLKAFIPNADALDKSRELAKGEVWHVKPEREGFTAELIVPDDVLPALKELGVSVDIHFDSRRAPDPKEQVSKTNRFADELARLKRERGE